MQILGITSQKGGVGKTTLAMNLAVAASGTGTPTIVFDLDPQASAMGYYDRRVSGGGADQPKVVSIQAVRLPQELKSAMEEGYELAIIDTPPNVSGNAVHISQAGDLILIPAQPSALDLDAIQISIDIVKQSGRPGAVILNRCKPHGTIAEEAQQLIEQRFQFPVVPQIIGDRVAYNYAATSGQGVLESEPSSKAGEEIAALWKWVSKALTDVKRADEATLKEVANG
ncbi:MAG: ParA family protein [Pseudomonadota bacterium]